MSQPLARIVSVVAHPLVFGPAVAFAAMLRQGAPPETIRASAAAFGMIAVLILGYSLWKVRRGQWGHMDAVDPGERRGFNAAALLILGGGAALAWFAGPRLLALGLLAAALIVAVAALAAGRLKLSQHVAYAAMAAVVACWVTPWAAAAALLIVAALGWSRLRLGRHSGAEVLAGAGVGLAAGLLFALLLPYASGGAPARLTNTRPAPVVHAMPPDGVGTR